MTTKKAAVVVERRDDLAMPEQLDARAREAAELVIAFLKERGLTYTGGCRVFYSAAEWAARGEQYGRGAALIVVHDGGEHARAFSYDACYHRGRAEEYADLEAMQERLQAAGFLAEQCTTWHSAIYDERAAKRPTHTRADEAA